MSQTQKIKCKVLSSYPLSADPGMNGIDQCALVPFRHGVATKLQKKREVMKK